MLTEQKFCVHLTEVDRAKMQDIVQQQCGSPSRILRARILLHIDSLRTKNLPIKARELAEMFNVTDCTVRRIGMCYMREGLRTSLYGSHFTKIVRLKDKERSLLQQIHSGSQDKLSRYKLNQKIAQILLKADHDGNNADVSEIANESGCTKTIVTKIIRSYLEKGLNGILKQRQIFGFKLQRKDRNRLRDLLKQEVTYSWNHTHAEILLAADNTGTEIIWEEIAEQTGASCQTVRKVCKKYMSEGLGSVLNLTTHRSLIPFRNCPIRLNTEEQSWLKNVIETTCRDDIRRRALILLNADKNGRNLHNTDIVKLVGTTHETVRLICKRYAERGVKNTILSGCGDISKPAQKRTQTQKPKFYDLCLKPGERQFLQQIINSQDGTPSRINRARILLQVDQLRNSATSLEIASSVGVRDTTIYNVCRRYRNEGIEAAVNHKLFAGSRKTRTTRRKRKRRQLKR
ncbi:MAG: helix-turn-helix domain containing protein [Planctomycetaceae bacterium]|jgi:transposase|nr:helix-turn-helix domain containing protein [Planctomycetaceae bacterium]